MTLKITVFDHTFLRAGETYHKPVSPADDSHFEALARVRGFRLPDSYASLLAFQNGGEVRRSLFPTDDGDDAEFLSTLAGIGPDRYEFCLDLLTPLDWQQSSDETSPERLLVFDWDDDDPRYLALDYGKDVSGTEPSVVVVDVYRMVGIAKPLAPSFDAFLAALHLADEECYAGLPTAGAPTEEVLNRVCSALGASAEQVEGMDAYALYSDAWPLLSGVTLCPNLDYARDDD